MVNHCNQKNRRPGRKQVSSRRARCKSLAFGIAGALLLCAGANVQADTNDQSASSDPAKQSRLEKELRALMQGDLRDKRFVEKVFNVELEAMAPFPSKDEPKYVDFTSKGHSDINSYRLNKVPVPDKSLGGRMKTAEVFIIPVGSCVTLEVLESIFRSAVKTVSDNVINDHSAENGEIIYYFNKRAPNQDISVSILHSGPSEKCMTNFRIQQLN